MAKKNGLCKQLLSMLLSVALVMGSVPLSAIAADSNGASGVDDYGEAQTPAEEPDDDQSNASPQTEDGWSRLQARINEAENGETVQLDGDVVCAEDQECLRVEGENRSLTLDLNGHELDRNLTSQKDDGYVLMVLEGASLTIVDSSITKDNPGTGTITGGYSKQGGVFVGEGGTLTIESGVITANTASETGGGIFVQGILNLRGGTVQANTSQGLGGGIYVDEGGTLALEAGTITGNKAETCGGGIAVHDAAESSPPSTPQVTDKPYG